MTCIDDMLSSIDRRWMRSIEIRDGGDATVRQTTTRGSVCVCRGAPHVDVCLSVDDRDALVETDGPNRTHESHARATDRTTDRDDTD